MFRRASKSAENALRAVLLAAAALLVPLSGTRLSGASADFPKEFYRFLDWSVPHRVEPASITYVFDGDTIEDGSGRAIRLLGVNAPEIAHPDHGKYTNEPGGIEATRYTNRMARGKKVYLVVDRDNGRDHFGRTLAVVFMRNDLGKWLCLNWELVREGLAETLILPDNRLCVEPEWYRMQIVARRKRPEDYAELAKSYDGEGRSESAVETFQKGIRRFPEARALYEGLGELYMRMNLPGFAADIYLAFLERHEGDAAMRYGLAKAYDGMVTGRSLSLINYKSKAGEEWQRLVGTNYDAEAKERLKNLAPERAR